MAGPPSDYEADILADCQEAIGHRFRKPELLRSALTHTSGANTRLASFERLEFLGDAVLGLVCVEQLYHRFPEYQEGDMTKVKSAVVSRVACARRSSATTVRRRPSRPTTRPSRPRRRSAPSPRRPTRRRRCHSQLARRPRVLLTPNYHRRGVARK